MVSLLLGSAVQGQGVPPLVPDASPALSEAELADRMARARRQADDPLRRIREAVRGTPAPSAAAPGLVAAPSALATPAKAAAAAGAAVVTVTLPPVQRRTATADPREAIGRLLIQVARETEAAKVAARAASDAAAPVTAVVATPEAAPVITQAPPAAATVTQAAAAPAEPPGTQAALAPAQVAVSATGAASADVAATVAAYSPVLLHRVDPELAATTLGEGRALRFQLRFMIAPDGSVQDLVVQGSGDRQAMRAVRDAVSRWRYAPPGRPTPHTVELVVRFEA